MKVKELIEILNTVDENSEVILQADSEGNSYSPLDGLQNGYYIPENTWSGHFYDPEWTYDDVCMDEDEWEDLQNTTPLAVILYPLN